MVRQGPAVIRRRLAVTGRSAMALVLICVTTLLFEVVAPSRAWAERVPVPLGSAANFAILAGTTVTNTGLTVVNGDIGVSPGTALTGFPDGQLNGAFHSNDGPAVQAQADLAIAYNNAVARTSMDPISGDLGGTTRTTGVYSSVSGTFGIAGTVTLDAQGDPNAVFIFKAVSTLITAADSRVTLVNGAQSCNVFWQVGSSATFGANSTLRGDVLAFTSITVGAGLTADGRVMAINGAVTLDTDTITRSACKTPGPLSITAPGTADLGTAAPGGTVWLKLQPVTVTDARLLSTANWIATVDVSNFVTGTPVRTIARANASYWSGPASTTGVGTFTSGQPTVDNVQLLDQSRTAFTHTNGVGDNSATWNPTVSVQLPLSAVAGTYIGTLTFSVA